MLDCDFLRSALVPPRSSPHVTSPDADQSVIPKIFSAALLPTLPCGRIHPNNSSHLHLPSPCCFVRLPLSPFPPRSAVLCPAVPCPAGASPLPLLDGGRATLELPGSPRTLKGMSECPSFSTPLAKVPMEYGPVKLISRSVLLLTRDQFTRREAAAESLYVREKELEKYACLLSFFLFWS